MATNQTSIPDYFQSIALGLPGGGFRAAGFSLGILKFLDEVGLINHVEAISSVSGGTITAAKYAEMLCEGKKFPEFYDALYEWLYDNKLLENAVERFNKQKDFGHKRRTLINAFALEYAEEFLTSDFGALREGLKETHLKELIINATDFEHGLAFRFQTDTSARFGNGTYFLKKDYSAHIKLADALAASSCFPGGFEPIEFPNDFFDDTDLLDEMIEEKREKFIENDGKLKDFSSSIGLMDGGIIDNQGSSSYLTSGKLNHETYLIGNAGQEEIDPFEFHDNTKLNKVISIFTSWSTLLIFVIATGYILNRYGLNLASLIPIVLTVFLGIIHILLFTAKTVLNKFSGKRLFREIPRRQLASFLMNRIKSLEVLNLSIFLKNSKSSNISDMYQEDYSKVELLSIYDLKLKKNIESDIKTELDVNNGKHLQILGIEGSEDFYKASCEARNFSTTLWFDFDEVKKRKTLDSLILTGRAVCCLKLLKHMYVVMKKETDVSEKEIKAYFDKNGEVNHKWEGSSTKDYKKYKNETKFEKLKPDLKKDRYFKKLLKEWKKIKAEAESAGSFAT